MIAPKFDCIRFKQVATMNTPKEQAWFPHLQSTNHNTALSWAGTTLSYAELNDAINNYARQLLETTRHEMPQKQKEPLLNDHSIACLIPICHEYAIALLSIWRTGAIAVPLNIHAALPELEHALKTAGVSTLIVTSDFDTNYPNTIALRQLCETLNIKIKAVNIDLAQRSHALPHLNIERRALILFTSGTTNKPKATVITAANIRAQINTLTNAWAWQQKDVIPLFLPVHHLHGIINVLCCALWSGAQVDLYPKFDAEKVLKQVSQNSYTVFMAVPTIYNHILKYMGTLNKSEYSSIASGFKIMRLNVSGSAACPSDTFHRWHKLTGHHLLERYGMTEIGMAISNPYDGERRPGAVGLALPGVEVALFDEQGQAITKENLAGEIRVKSASIFQSYWNNPEATAASFKDGWFCTGDIAVVENGYYRIMGRASIDIIKSGGYKLSALEIESCLLTHSHIDECAVIGLDDDTWGEKVCAIAVLKPSTSLELSALREWCKDKISSYKIPKLLEITDNLPRNAMGKVTKPILKTLLLGKHVSS